MNNKLELNPNWKGGNRVSDNYPCPQCNKDRICEKRNSNRICRECYVSRGKKFNWNEWRAKVQVEAKEYAIQYKGGKCEDCGVKDLPSACYNFHHLNPSEKKFSLGHKFNQKISDEIIEELDKCELLCANCHMAKHAKQRGSGAYS